MADITVGTDKRCHDKTTDQTGTLAEWSGNSSGETHIHLVCWKCPVFLWAGRSQLPLKWEIHISPCLWRVLQKYMWNTTHQHDARGWPILSQMASSDSETALRNYLTGNTMELESVGCAVVSLLPWTSMPEWISLKKCRSWMIHALKATLCAECLQELGIINHRYFSQSRCFVLFFFQILMFELKSSCILPQSCNNGQEWCV